MPFCIYLLITHFIGITGGYDDLSYKKDATQSSTRYGPYDAENAVDRNNETCMRTYPIGQNSPDKTTWWKVDLGGRFSIYSVNVLFKVYEGYELRQRGRFAGFSLYVSNTGFIENSTLCYKDWPVLPTLNFTTTCTEHGRYVIFYNERLDGVSYPEGYLTFVYTELCEVIVLGCQKHGVYGAGCDIPCPANCEDFMCHIQHGSCYACYPGWVGTFCTIECKDGWYGINCSQQCVGHCIDNTPCNHVTGLCDGGCDNGWTGLACERECIDGTFGKGCINNCSGHCLNHSTCNKHTGYCDKGCSPGYTNAFCSENCISGYFGNGCSNHCSGHCLNNEVCYHINGTCTAGCQDGYIGNNCNQSCKVGFFGRDCSSVCSPYCKTCRHTDGYCSCFAGYTGYKCDKACFKSYGENCRHPCSEHCFNKICDRFNGSCLTGCAEGFYGERCEKNIYMPSQGLSCSIFWIVGFSFSLAFNIILVACSCVFCRGTYTQIASTSRIFLKCCKNSVPDIYTDSDIKQEETSTYQELDVYASGTESAYQNTVLR